MNILGADECWEWTASLGSRGYGQFGVGYKLTGSHRVSYELANGAIPEGLLVCHHCDNKRCCNPAHLFLGTAQDNTQDMVNKGRHKYISHYGEKHGKSKLTAEQVAEIRRRYSGKYGEKAALAREYAVSPSQIGIIINNKNWQEG